MGGRGLDIDKMNYLALALHAHVLMLGLGGGIKELLFLSCCCLLLVGSWLVGTM